MNHMPIYRSFLMTTLAGAGVTLGWLSGSAAAFEHAHVCRYCRGAHGDAATIDYHAIPEVSDRKYAPDRQVDLLHIKLDVTPDFAAHTVAGTATLRFAPIAKPLTTLRLDGINLKVADVRASHAVSDHSADAESVTVAFDPPVPVGAEAWVEIDYSAEPKQGLYFRTPDMGFPAGDMHLWTQGEPHEARHWIPCFDYPNERATTEIICHVPADMTVVSNGRLVGEVADEAGKLKAVHWTQEKSHVSYLICLIAGRLHKLEDKHRDVPLGFYTQPSLKEHAANAFRDTRLIMEFFEEEIGLPYPWNKYDQCTCGDYPIGGMENTTITTLTPRTIYSDATENIRSSHGLDAHEMAHQWFGDYVTCKDWSHLWLNEGFATYYALLYEGKKFGRDAMLYGLYLDARDDILPRAGDRRPIVYRRYNEPDEQFDYRSYPKGSWVLHMLRSQFGEDLYRRAIRAYLERHALGEVESEDLREAFEELSGEPLDRFFDQWLYHAGHPELKITYRWLAGDKLAHVTIEQTQETNDDVLLFELPTKLQFVVDGKPTDENIRIDGKRHDFYVTLPGEPTVVLFDPDYSLLTKVDFKKSDALLEAQLKHEPNAIARVLACEGLAKRDTAGSVAALQHALQNDPFYGVRSAAALALRQIRTGEAVAALVASTKQEDARIRLRVVEELGKAYRDEAREKLLDVVANEKNPAVAAAAIRSLGNYQGKPTTDAVKAALKSKSFTNDELIAAFGAIGTLDAAHLAPALIKTLQERSLDVDQRNFGEGLATLAKVSAGRPRRRAAAYEALAGFLNSPRPLIQEQAVRALGDLKEPRARDLLEPLARGSEHDPLTAAAKSALRQLDGETKLVPAEVGELRREVRELRESHEKLEKSLKEIKGKNEATKDDAKDEDEPDNAKEEDADKDDNNGERGA